MNNENEICSIYDQAIYVESQMICNKFYGELEFDYVKSLIKESIDPLFYFDNGEVKGANLETYSFLDIFFGCRYWVLENNVNRPFSNKEEKEYAENRFIENKIFDNKEVFDIFEKKYNSHHYSYDREIWDNYIYRHHYGDYDNVKDEYLKGSYYGMVCLLKELTTIKLDYIKEKLKKEVEEKQKQRFNDFLSSEFEKIPLENSLKIYKNFTEDQKMLFMLSIAKDIKGIKNKMEGTTKIIDEK